MRALLAILIAVALSGCFGLPEGSADFNDAVTISFVAVDPDTGAFLLSALDDAAYEEGGIQFYDAGRLFQAFNRAGGDMSLVQDMLVQEGAGFAPIPKIAFDQAVMDAGALDSVAIQATFVVGSGDSGLGMDVEHAVVGLPVNQTIVLESDGATRAFTGVQTAPAALPEGFQPATRTWTSAEFQREFEGAAPVVGETHAWNDLLQVEVTSVDGDTVMVTYQRTETTTVPVPVVGGVVVLAEVEGGYQYELDLVSGQRFEIVPDQFGRTTLNLPAGSYRSMAREGDTLNWMFAPGPHADIKDRAVTFHITVDAVTINEVPVDTEHYGVRTSPVTYGHGTVEDYGRHYGGHDHGAHDHDDGHDDHADDHGDGHDDGHDHQH